MDQVTRSAKREVRHAVGAKLREANIKFDALISELDPERSEKIVLEQNPMYIWGQINGQFLNAIEEMGRAFGAGMRSVGR